MYLSNEMQALKQLAEIHPGYPFRGRLPLSAEGDVFVVQFRHIVVGERLEDANGEFLDRATLTGRKQATCLVEDDIVFMAKGVRNDAALVGDVPANTVCTPNFYHIRLKPEVGNLLPEFLAWQINYRDAQRYFAVCSQGSAASSITKSQLENLPIAIPTIEQQRFMVNLANSAAREQQLLNALIKNRQRMIDAAGQKILHPDGSTGH